MVIYWVRHGQIGSNLAGIYSGRSEEPLTEIGQSQALEMAAQFNGKDIDSIYASPLRRTLQTAEQISLVSGKPVVAAEELIEIGMGPWHGLQEKEVEEKFPEAWKTWNESPADLNLEGRETLHDIANRVKKFIDEALDKHSKSSIVAVSHYGVMRVARLLNEGRDLNEYKSIKVPNCAIIPLEYS